MEHAYTLAPVIILLVVGILAIAVMRPLKLSPIVGYLLAGMLIGSHGLGLVSDSDMTHLLAELGVVFLLFDIGLHFSLAHIWDSRRDILGLGPLQIVLSTIALALVLWLLSIPPAMAVIVAATLALSSTAVVAQILADNQLHNSPVAVSTTAVLIFQDICAIFLLILAASMGNQSVSLGFVIGSAALKAMLAFGVAILIGRYVIGPLFRWIARSRDNEIFTAIALLIVLATAEATSLLGLSLTLGAFLAGMIISETPYRHVIQTEVKPFRGLLLGFFFITVGMALDTRVLLEKWWIIGLIGLGLIVLKSLLTFLAARLMKVPSGNAFQMSLLLAQGSEFAFVILAMPAIQSQLGAERASLLIIAVALSMALTPVFVTLARSYLLKKADQNWQESIQEQAPAKSADVDVIIVGMSHAGRTVANALTAHELTYKGVEVHHDCFVEACSMGYNVGFGDATDLRLMDTIKMSHARMVVITFANYDIARQLAPIVLQRYPDLKLMVLVNHETDRQRFSALGMQAIIQNSFPHGLDLAGAVLGHFAIASEKIHNWMQLQQQKELDNELESQSAAIQSN